MVCDLHILQDEDSDEDDASEHEHSGESDADGLKSPHGKRKASSLKSLPIQRPEKKSKSTYKMPLHEARIDTFSIETPRVEVVYEEEIESVPISKATLTAW